MWNKKKKIYIYECMKTTMSNAYIHHKANIWTLQLGVHENAFRTEWPDVSYRQQHTSSEYIYKYNIFNTKHEMLFFFSLSLFFVQTTKQNFWFCVK